MSAPTAGGTRVEVVNSGLEVWLYDDGNLDAIRALGVDADEEGAGGMPAAFSQLTAQGLVVGYSLMQDDGVDVEVVVGDALPEAFARAGRWLVPQTAYLRLPTGTLCIESNDASRIGPEVPMERGARVTVPPGDYRLTLHRVDHEALDRARITWDGPQEVLLLTPGGTPDAAAPDLLPFEPIRDLSWVGRFTVTPADGGATATASALAWFGDHWDTCVLNLDAAALAAMDATPGSVLRVTVPAAGLTLYSTVGDTWDAASRLVPPDGVDQQEYGYATLMAMQEWDGAEALYCRRDRTTTRVEDPQQFVWLEAQVERLAARAEPRAPARPGFGPTDLAEARYFDEAFLGLVLCDLLPGVDDMDGIALPDALARLGQDLAAFGLRAVGDRLWAQQVGRHVIETSVRFYTGAPDRFAFVLAREGHFEFVFASEFADGTWQVTGLADEIERRAAPPEDDDGAESGIRVRNEDRALAELVEAHAESVGEVMAEGGGLAPAPTDDATALAAFERLISRYGH